MTRVEDTSTGVEGAELLERRKKRLNEKKDTTIVPRRDQP
jgi:hypothetical protein